MILSPVGTVQDFGEMLTASFVGDDRPGIGGLLIGGLTQTSEALSEHPVGPAIVWSNLRGFGRG